MDHPHNLTMAALLERLTHRLDLLTGGARPGGPPADAAQRVEWNYDLLPR